MVASEPRGGEQSPCGLSDADVEGTAAPVASGSTARLGEVSDRAVHVIVLAAGAGTRMKSSLPKVLHLVGGTPMLGHVLATASRVASGMTVVVLRFAASVVRPYVDEIAPHAIVALQDEIPGTGRAVECGLEAICASSDSMDEGDVVIVSGDVPLLSADALLDLVAAHRRDDALASILTAVVDDPTGYGRIIRDSTGVVVRIVEERDASPEEKAVREFNSGTYVFDVAALRGALALVGTANSQGEKYLTDVVALLAQQRPGAVRAHPVADTWLVQGVNDVAQLTAVNAEFARRVHTERPASHSN